MLSTVAAYKLMAGNLDRSLKATAGKPEVARATAYYLAKIGNVKSIDDFLGDSRIYNYAMKAFGLQDMAFAKAFIKKLLTEGIGKSDAFANKLSDPRYRQFAEVFNFAQFGDATTIFESTKQGTADRYVRQILEEDAGRQNEGARLALYFERKAAGIKNAFHILGDPALLKVVQTAAGLPVQMSLADIDQQAAMITAKLDIDDLAEPGKLKSFLNRFVTLYDVQNPIAPPVTPIVAVGNASAGGVGANLLAALQNLRLGGR